MFLIKIWNQSIKENSKRKIKYYLFFWREDNGIKGFAFFFLKILIFWQILSKDIINLRFVTLPFTLKFRDTVTQSDEIYTEIKNSYGDFVSTLNQKNLLGYVPAYVSFRNINKFVDLYLENKQSIESEMGQLNFVPLMIDCKATYP